MYIYEKFFLGVGDWLLFTYSGTRNLLANIRFRWYHSGKSIICETRESS